jgi:hypothetical protein
MKKKQLVNTRLLVGLAGCEIECLSAEGEVRWLVGYHAGCHYIDGLSVHMYPGDELRFIGSASVLARSAEVRAQSFGEVERESGANPTYRPSPMDEAKAEMIRMMKKINNAEKRLDQRLNSLHALEKHVRIEPEGGEPEAVDVPDSGQPVTEVVEGEAGPSKEEGKPVAPVEEAQGGVQ